MESDDWTEFRLTFDYKKELSDERLKNYDYNLSIVFASSVEGASFRGAVGSVLYVDEVSLICK